MADVPLKTNPLPRPKHPAASVWVSASLQPTPTGIPAGSPNRRAAAAVTVPRRAQAAAIGGQARSAQPHAASISAAGEPSPTRQMPLDDQGSDAGLPVSCIPRWILLDPAVPATHRPVPRAGHHGAPVRAHQADPGRRGADVHAQVEPVAAGHERM
jgi:hypothetical protein